MSSDRPTPPTKPLQPTEPAFTRQAIQWGRPPQTTFRTGPTPRAAAPTPLVQAQQTAKKPPRPTGDLFSTSLIPTTSKPRPQVGLPPSAAAAPSPQQPPVIADKPVEPVRPPEPVAHAPMAPPRPLPAAPLPPVPLPAAPAVRAAAVAPPLPAGFPERQRLEESPFAALDRPAPVVAEPKPVESAVARTSDRPAPSSRKWPIIIGVVALLVAVTAFAAWRLNSDLPASVDAPVAAPAKTDPLSAQPIPELAVQAAPLAPAPAETPAPPLDEATVPREATTATPRAAAAPPIVARTAPVVAPRPATPAPSAPAAPPIVVTVPPEPVPEPAGPPPTAARPAQSDPDAPVVTRPQDLD